MEWYIVIDGGGVSKSLSHTCLDTWIQGDDLVEEEVASQCMEEAPGEEVGVLV